MSGQGSRWSPFGRGSGVIQLRRCGVCVGGWGGEVSWDESMCGKILKKLYPWLPLPSCAGVLGMQRERKDASNARSKRKGQGVPVIYVSHDLEILRLLQLASSLSLSRLSLVSLSLAVMMGFLPATDGFSLILFPRFLYFCFPLSPVLSLQVTPTRDFSIGEGHHIGLRGMRAVCIAVFLLNCDRAMHSIELRQWADDGSLSYLALVKSTRVMPWMLRWGSGRPVKCQLSHGLKVSSADWATLCQM